MTTNPAVLGTFLEETEERLTDLESGILAMSDMADRLENILDMIRTGDMSPDPDVTDALLQAVDRIHDLMDDVKGSDRMYIQASLAALNSVIPATNGAQA